MIGLEGVIWYIVLLDSIICNLMAWFDGKWYRKNFRILSRWFPLAKGWCFYYLVLVLWIGAGLWRLGKLGF